MQRDQGLKLPSAQEGAQRRPLPTQSPEADRGMGEETGKRSLGLKGHWTEGHVCSGETKGGAQLDTAFRLSWGQLRRGFGKKGLANKDVNSALNISPFPMASFFPSCNIIHTSNPNGHYQKVNREAYFLYPSENQYGDFTPQRHKPLFAIPGDWRGPDAGARRPG